MRRLLEVLVVTVLASTIIGVCLGGAFAYSAYKQDKATVAVVKPKLYTYTISHMDGDGKSVKHTMEVEAVDLKGNCIMFFKEFHVAAVLCPGSMQEVSVVDTTEAAK